MRVIHLLRKPLSEGTVTANVVKHGTGGLNIDASRISTADNLNGGAYAENASERHDGAENWRYKRGEHGNTGEYQQPTGRWPANLILQHLEGCQQAGMKKVGSGRFVAHDAVVRKSPMMDPGKGWNGNSLDNSKKNAPNPYGKEAVTNWICVEGCPVQALDEQTAVTKSTGGRIGNKDGGHIYGGGKGLQGAYRSGNPGFGDTGGASRFFKQVGGTKDA
jgi:hypothetical protein